MYSVKFGRWKMSSSHDNHKFSPPPPHKQPSKINPQKFSNSCSVILGILNSFSSMYWFAFATRASIVPGKRCQKFFRNMRSPLKSKFSILAASLCCLPSSSRMSTSISPPKVQVTPCATEVLFSASYRGPASEATKPKFSSPSSSSKSLSDSASSTGATTPALGCTIMRLFR